MSLDNFRAHMATLAEHTEQLAALRRTPEHERNFLVWAWAGRDRVKAERRRMDEAAVRYRKGN